MGTFQEIIKSDHPVLVDFHADWCAPCKTMNPILKNIKKEVGDKLKIIKINVDNNQQVANKFQVKGIPTFILFQNSEIKTCATFEETFKTAFDDGNYKIIIPIENSLAGRVADIHYLLPKYKLQIYSEHFQKVPKICG